jgi:hypothetical protein
LLTLYKRLNRDIENIFRFGRIVDRKGPLGRPRCGWEDNIKMYVREIGWGGMNWIHLSRYRDQGRVPVVNSLVVERLVVAQEVLSSMEVIS